MGNHLSVPVKYLTDDYDKYFENSDKPDLNTRKGRKQAKRAFKHILSDKKGNFDSASKYVKQLREKEDLRLEVAREHLQNQADELLAQYNGNINDPEYIKTLYNIQGKDRNLTQQEMDVVSNAINTGLMQTLLASDITVDNNVEVPQYSDVPLVMASPIKQWEAPSTPLEREKPKIRRSKNRQTSSKNLEDLLVFTPSTKSRYPDDPQYYDNARGQEKGMKANFYLARKRQEPETDMRLWNKWQMALQKGDTLSNEAFRELQRTEINRPALMRRYRNTILQDMGNRITQGLASEKDLSNIINFWESHNLGYDHNILTQVLWQIKNQQQPSNR